MSSNRKRDRDGQLSSKKPRGEKPGEEKPGREKLNVPAPAALHSQPSQLASSARCGGLTVDQERGQRDAAAQGNPFTEGTKPTLPINPFSPREPLSSKLTSYPWAEVGRPPALSNPFAGTAKPPPGNPFVEGTRPEPPSNPFAKPPPSQPNNPFAEVPRPQFYEQRAPFEKSGLFPPPVDPEKCALPKIDSDRNEPERSQGELRRQKKLRMRLQMEKVSVAADMALKAMKRVEHEIDQESGDDSASPRPANPSPSGFEELVQVVICGNCGKPNHKLHICPGPVEADGCVAGCPLHNTKEHSLDDCRPSWDVPEETVFRILISRRAGLPPLRTSLSWPQLAVANAEKGLRAIPVAAFPLTRSFSCLVPDELIQRYSVNNPSVKQLGVDPRTHTYADLIENIEPWVVSEREKPVKEGESENEEH
ncbi:uncharacterized protein F4807DRAFT_469354 [Annulohypoxylon truncatum]|uniref:uncharacterized protein n=1 Tax=Annulohypoxylon truncatum TaxID=327061 RepID=UPI002007B410|nr:uncharacterized protein F4807DRAFT_469354 [Annulohypoxylon truncatum]KAI1207559.1 hypothetical protein F4807DRAFT_469354 [Annulohypoxylon truncatum]